MKNYSKSDYALNKANKSAIVYYFADGTTYEYTLEVYLSENPGKTESDFLKLKDDSDAIYHEQDKSEYRQTYKNAFASALERTETSTSLSPEIVLFDLPELVAIRLQQRKLAKLALDKLTDVQRRRYLLYVKSRLTEEQIAEIEVTTHQAISKSLLGAKKKINKFLATA